MSVKALCEASKVSTESYRKWKLGLTRHLRGDVAERVAEALGVPISAIVDNTDAPARDPDLEVIEEYISGSMGADLTSEQRDELRLSKNWIPRRHPMTIREVHMAADLIRSAFNNNVPGALNRPKNRPQR